MYRHVIVCYFVIFFFKPKTAYELRISDWSTDVCSSDLEIGFDPFELRFLPRGQVEFPVEKGVQFGLVRFRRIRHHAADENTSDGSGESDERDEKKAARRHRYRTSSKVEGASVLGGPKGAKGLAATAGGGTAVPATMTPPNEPKK